MTQHVANTLEGPVYGTLEQLMTKVEEVAILKRGWSGHWLPYSAGGFMFVRFDSKGRSVGFSANRNFASGGFHRGVVVRPVA